jgi:hypothetical protein
VIKVKNKFKWGAKMEVHNGENTIFWNDVWRGEVPLKLVFPKLYEYCRNKNCTVSDCWEGGEWRMDFSKPLSPVDAEGWEDMLDMLSEVRLDKLTGSWISPGSIRLNLYIDSCFIGGWWTSA